MNDPSTSTEIQPQVQDQSARDYPGGRRRRRPRLPAKFKTWYVPRRTGAIYSRIVKRLNGDGDTYLLLDTLILISGGRYRIFPNDGERSLMLRVTNEQIRAAGVEWSDARLRRVFKRLDSAGVLKIVGGGYRGQAREVIFLGAPGKQGKTMPAFLLAADSGNAGEEIERSQPGSQPSPKASEEYWPKRPVSTGQSDQPFNSLEENDDLPSEAQRQKKGTTSPKRAQRAEGGARSPASPSGRKSRPTRENQSTAPVVQNKQDDLVVQNKPNLTSRKSQKEARDLLTTYGGKTYLVEGERFGYSSPFSAYDERLVRDVILGKATIWYRRGNDDAIKLAFSALAALDQRRDEVANVQRERAAAAQRAEEWRREQERQEAARLEAERQKQAEAEARRLAREQEEAERRAARDRETRRIGSMYERIDGAGLKGELERRLRVEEAAERARQARSPFGSRWWHPTSDWEIKWRVKFAEDLLRELGGDNTSQEGKA